MNKLPFQVKKLDPNAKLPEKSDPADAGIDIFTNESKTLQPGEMHMFSTGIAVAIPEGTVALIWDRSGLGSKGIHRFGGVIDSGYRGEWKIILANFSKEPYTVEPGDKIAQCVLQQFERADISEVAELPDSIRGDKGFGSSGK